MPKDITIRDIQEWEKSFSKKKSVPQEEETAVKIAVLKLMEEAGEVAKAILEKEWDEVPAEVSDVIVFACKIANIAEEMHGTDKLSNVLKRKMEYCDRRKYDRNNKKLDKPADKEFK